jgi:hypothetical protein
MKQDKPDDSTQAQSGESLAMSVPDEHAAAFVAEVFEDAERSTTWEEVVDAMVSPTARDAWESLSSTEQVIEVLQKAHDYDQQAADLLEDVPLSGEQASLEIRQTFEDALRHRRNADIFRDGIADAYASGLIDDEELEGAVESFEFETETIARREDVLEDVASVYELDFKPYGGTLIQEDEEQKTEADAW